MRTDQHISVSGIVARILLLALPCSFAIYFLLNNLSQYYSIIQGQNLLQSLAFMLGMTSGIVLCSLRFRWLTTSLILVALYGLLQTLIPLMAGDEFDSFLRLVQFRTLSILFFAGWLSGFMLLRFRWFSFLFAAYFLLAGIYLISKTGGIDLRKFLSLLMPVLFFSFYIIYTALHLIKKDNWKEVSWLKLFGRLLILGLLLVFSFIASILFVKSDIKQLLLDNKSAGQQGNNSLLKQNKDGSYSMNDQMGIGSKYEQSKELIFCAKIENYFEGTEDPNPIYLTAGHYNSYDTLSETFEIDRKAPFDDNFEPDLSKIPLFFIAQDSAKLRNAFASKYMQTVAIEVYNKKLPRSYYLAPTTAYWAQPISVEPSFRNEFKTAFRAKSSVSKLNSAYFVYNARDPFIQLFQQQRYEVLRRAAGYAQIDSTFIRYYTKFPASAAYLPIKNLADSLAQGKITTIDKVLAIRDYFLQTNSLGEQVYKYSNNPGIPGIPGKSRLTDFLFKTKKGYCAYYAGATLFMLRAMGIPSRISYGFSTIDRSSKNKGWYWYYGNQAHAWVQVYFPEYGWLDFDTTVGNDEMQEAEHPDGTPPLQPPKPSFVESAAVQSIDTASGKVSVQPISIIFHEQEYHPVTYPNSLLAKRAKIFIDSTESKLSELKRDDIISAVSYDEQLNNFKTPSLLPNPIAVDEIYFIRKKSVADEPVIAKQTKASIHWPTLLLCIGLGLFCVFILFPLALLLYYKHSSRQGALQRANRLFNYSSYYLYQLKLSRQHQSSLDYARWIDDQLHINYSAFIKLYDQLRFSNGQLSETEMMQLHIFEDTLPALLRRSFSWRKRCWAWVSTWRSIKFLIHKQKYSNQ